MTLRSLPIGAAPRALALRISAVTAAADPSAPGVPPPNRVPGVPGLTAPLLPSRVEAPAKKARSPSLLASTKALAPAW